ncbi:Cytochrome P450, partial [Dillenia turbinata]
MECTMWWWTWVLGAVPVGIVVIWWWNEGWYVLCSRNGKKLPPGHMGFPFVGETLLLLWYFKVLRRPDDFINSKRRRYGDEVGLYKTKLFGYPSVIAYTPEAIKFVYYNSEAFILQWPNPAIVGNNALVTVHGKAHTRIRNLVTNVLNRPAALRHIALLVQPRIAAALHSWAQKGQVKAYDEIKKVTFENIGNLFVNIEPGPLLDTLDRLFVGLLAGVRAQKLYVPGTAYYHAMQCREELTKIFRAKLKKRKQNRLDGVECRNDLMDGLMDIKDEEGNQLRDEEILDNIVSLIVAGYETTSLVLTWAIYYIAKSPQVFQKLREENVALSEEKNGEFITSDDLSKLKYTYKVIEETLRLANPAAFSFRLATKDMEYEGYRIPKGWKILPWVRYIHTNPENYENPMCFNPDRWN